MPHVTCGPPTGLGAKTSFVRQPLNPVRRCGPSEPRSLHRYRLRNASCNRRVPVDITIIVNTRITFNGQEYASVDAMPTDVRRAYERALVSVGDDTSSRGRSAGTSSVHPAPTMQIVFNGQQYSSADQMPANVRKLYDDVVAALDADRNRIPGRPTGQRPLADDLPPPLSGTVAPQAINSRVVIACIIVAIVLLAAFLIWSLGGAPANVPR